MVNKASPCHASSETLTVISATAGTIAGAQGDVVTSGGSDASVVLPDTVAGPRTSWAAGSP